MFAFNSSSLHVFYIYNKERIRIYNVIVAKFKKQV